MGRRAQSEGDLAEQMARLSFNQYQHDNCLVWFKTYPEIKVIYRGKRQKPDVVITGEANPDYLLCLQEGRFMWLEIKTWEAKERHTETRRLHQFRQMRESARMGALAAYLVQWKWKGESDWRLHSLLKLEELNSALLFLREDGLPVRCDSGWPDWLPLVRSEHGYKRAA